MRPQDEIIEEAVSEGREHKGRALILMLGVIALALLILSGVMFYNGYTTTRDQARAATNLAEQVQAACEDPDTAPRNISDICERADKVVEDGASAGIPGEKGDPGVPGEPGPPPSAAQVANAVALYCAGGRCQGSDGANATPAQVAEAVATYCNNRGECRGPEGSAGEAGRPGDTGPEGPVGPQGPQGPPPSDTQVQQAVASYCSTRNECRGPEGPRGEEGDPGQPGRGIQSVECDGLPTQSFTIVYTDGSSETVECS